MDFIGTGNDTLWFQGPGFDPATAPASYVAEPTVTSTKARGAQTVVRGSFDAVPGQTYVVRVYASENRYNADFGNGMEHFGEAQTYLGSITVTATGSTARFTALYTLPGRHQLAHRHPDRRRRRHVRSLRRRRARRHRARRRHRPLVLAQPVGDRAKCDAHRRAGDNRRR